MTNPQNRHSIFSCKLASLVKTAWRFVVGFLHDFLFVRPMPQGVQQARPISQNIRFGVSARFLIPVLGVIVLCIGVLCSLVKLQFYRYEDNLQLARRRLRFSQRLLGTRGPIYDIDNNMLAVDKRTCDLYVTPKQFLDSLPMMNRKMTQEKQEAFYQEFCQWLANACDLPLPVLQSRLQKALTPSFPVVILETIDMERVAAAYKLKVRYPQYLSITPPGEKQEHGGWRVAFDPRSCEDTEILARVCGEVEKKLQLEPDKIQASIQRTRKQERPALLKRKIDLDEANDILKRYHEWAKVSDSNKYRCAPSAIYFDASTKRFYPKGKMLSNLIGFCDLDGKALGGVEKLMDDYLKGEVKRKMLDLDGRTPRSAYAKEIYDPELNGAAVHLTVQLAVQQIVENAMDNLVAQHRPKRAYAVMLQPQTGAIMALAQYPSEDFNGERCKDAAGREFHALYTCYEPGSIMKAISVSSAIDYSNLSIDQEYDCEDGEWRFRGGKAIHEHGRMRLGITPLWKIIQKSSNIGPGKAVTENMTDKRFYEYLLSFGMGRKTQVGFFPRLEGENTLQTRYFPSESPGILKPEERWNKIDIARICYGHTISVTPFQMVQAYAAIANGGEMMQPYIVDRLVKSNGEIIRSIPHVKSQPISQEAALRIIECLKTVVKPGGTAVSAAVPGYTVAGKTGTAIKAVRMPNGKIGYDRRLNVASFVGFVPADAPAFVMLITVDEPSGKQQYGGSVCGSTFSLIASETLKILQVPPTSPEELQPKKSVRTTQR